MSRMSMEFQRMIDELRSKKSTPTRDEQKIVKRQTKADVIDVVRKQVFALDAACICGVCRPSKSDEMHEIVSRSALRGKRPEEVFSVRNCVRLSRKCHGLVTGQVGKGKALLVRCLDADLGAMGPVELTWRKTGKQVVYIRTKAAR